MSEPYISCKWPALVVVGQPVTEQQAAEILVRTAHWPLSSNERNHDTLFNHMAGFPTEASYMRYAWTREDWAAYDAKIEAANARLRIVTGLEYLINYQLTSSWFGGPHGWCSWNGTIGCRTFNVGKWPSVEGITEEWTKIAEEFPFLDLRAQVFSGESCEEGIQPTAEWVIKDGKVKCIAPESDLGYPEDLIGSMVDFPSGVGATEQQVALGLICYPYQLTPEELENGS